MELEWTSNNKRTSWLLKLLLPNGMMKSCATVHYHSKDGLARWTPRVHLLQRGTGRPPAAAFLYRKWVDGPDFRRLSEAKDWVMAQLVAERLEDTS